MVMAPMLLAATPVVEVANVESIGRAAITRRSRNDLPVMGHEREGEREQIELGKVFIY